MKDLRAVVEMRRDRATTGGRAPCERHQILLAPSLLHAGGQNAGETLANRRSPWRAVRPGQHARLARSTGRGDGEDGILVDIEGARSAGTSLPFAHRL